MDRLGQRPSRTWDEAALKWLEETSHKATHSGDTQAILVVVLSIAAMVWVMVEAVSYGRGIGRPLGVIGFVELFSRESLMLAFVAGRIGDCVRVALAAGTT